MLDDIERALTDRIQTLAAEPIVAWWGVPFDPVKGTPYLLAEISARQVRSMALGASAPELWEGFLQLTVAQPTSDGMAGARTRADAVRAHFARGLTLIKNSAQVVIMERSVQPAFAMPDWLNIPVVINWICEEVHS